MQFGQTHITATVKYHPSMQFAEEVDSLVNKQQIAIHANGAEDGTPSQVVRLFTAVDDAVLPSDSCQE